MKRLLAITLILLFAIAAPAALLAKEPAQKLKDRVSNFSEYDQTVEEILNQGPQAVPDLIVLLKEKQKDVTTDEGKRHWGAKVTAMNILGEIKAKDALTVLKDMLVKSESLSAINNSARAIGNIGGDSAYKILEEVLIKAGSFKYDNNNEERKKAVIAAMGLCENKKAVPYLLNEMVNPGNDEVTRIYAAGSLGLLGIKDGLDIASAGLESNDEYVRMAAIRAMGVIGSTSSIEPLNRALEQHPEYVYQKTAKLSILQIESEQMSDDDKIEHIKRKLVQNPDKTEFVQWGTLKLKKINSAHSKKALQELSDRNEAGSETLKHAAKLRVKTMK